MRLRLRSSVGATRTAARRRWGPNSRRSARIAPGLPPISMFRPRGCARSRARTGKSRIGSTPPSTPSARSSRPMASDSDNFQVEPPPDLPTRKVVMAHVTVTINGRHYRMACEDGQESHLERLANDLDRQVEQLRGSFGEIGDNRLLVMAALTISDELNETKQHLRRLEAELAGLQDARMASADRSQATQAAVVAALNAAAERIERVTRSLNQSIGGEVVVG